MNYMPPGKYPKDTKFNINELYPEIFKDISLVELSQKLSYKDFCTLLDSGFFLFSSRYQDNYGAGLVMLLSAIENLSGSRSSLEDILCSKEFERTIKKLPQDKTIRELMKETIAKHKDQVGTAQSIYKFYKENLTKKQKKQLISGLTYAQYQSINKSEAGELFTVNTPVRPPQETEEEIDIALIKVLKSFIYDIRNSFVHRANYFPFPDKKTLREQGLVRKIRSEGEKPKEEWHIEISFQDLHKMTKEAFIKFWINKNKVTKEI